MKKIDAKKAIIISVIGLFLIAGIYIVSKGSYASNTSTDNGTNSLAVIDESIVLDCSDEIFSPSETVTCTIKGNDFTTQVSSLTAKLVIGNNLTLGTVNFEEASWQGDGSEGKIDLYTADNKKGDFDIVEFTIAASNITTGVDTNISLTDIEISDENFDTYQIDDVSLDIRIASNVSTLSSLTVTGGNFTFNANTTTYNLEIDSDEVTIAGTATNNKATVTGTGVKKLNYGKNTFNVVVKAENGATTTYTLVITRPEELDFTDDVTVDNDNKYLTFVMDEFEFTVSNMLDKITTTGDIIITDADGSGVDTNGYVGTGYKINIKLSTNEYNYTAIVLGDTNGDGKITVADVSKSFQYYRNKKDMGGIVYNIAGDVVVDNNVGLNDVAKLFQYLRKTKDSLK